MINQISAGIILYRMEKGKILYLLLQHKPKYWNFPKGKIEPGEKKIETAFRETREETGIPQSKIRLERDFCKSYRYTFRVEEGKMIYKIVSFYLGRAQFSKVILSHEHQNFEWFEYEKALKYLRHKNSRIILIHAHRYLLQKFLKQRPT